jgi:hypothetical protein
MPEPRLVSCYGFIDRTYVDVRTVLLRDTLALFQRATTSASARARSIAVSLKLAVAGVELAVDVRLLVRRMVDEKFEGETPRTRIELTWEGLNSPGLLPSMLATLLVWPLSETETQVEMEGSYWVPMGPLGSLFEAAIGHRIAQATVLRFLDDVLEQLLDELPPPQ